MRDKYFEMKSTLQS